MERCGCGWVCLACASTDRQRAELQALAVRVAFGKAEIRRSVGEIEASVQAVESYRKSTIQQLQTACDRITAELTELRDFLQIALIEAESQLETVNRKPRSPLAQQLLAGLDAPLFHFQLAATPFSDSFCRIETADSFWTEPETALMPGLWDGCLQLYNVADQNCVSFSQVKLDAGAVLCMLDDKELLAIGGFPAYDLCSRLCRSIQVLLFSVCFRWISGRHPHSQ